MEHLNRQNELEELVDITTLHPKGKISYKKTHDNVKFLIDRLSYNQAAKDAYASTLFRGKKVFITYKSEGLTDTWTLKTNVNDQDAKNTDRYCQQLEEWMVRNKTRNGSPKIYLKTALVRPNPNNVNDTEGDEIGGKYVSRVYARERIPPDTLISRVGGRLGKHYKDNIVQMAANPLNDLLVAPAPIEWLKIFYRKKITHEELDQIELNPNEMYAFVTCFDDSRSPDHRHLYSTSFVKFAQQNQVANAKLVFFKRKNMSNGRYEDAALCLVSLNNAIEEHEEILLKPTWDWNDFGEEELVMWSKQEPPELKYIRLKVQSRKRARGKLNNEEEEEDDDIISGEDDGEDGQEGDDDDDEELGVDHSNQVVQLVSAKGRRIKVIQIASKEPQIKPLCVRSDVKKESYDISIPTVSAWKRQRHGKISQSRTSLGGEKDNLSICKYIGQHKSVNRISRATQTTVQVAGDHHSPLRNIGVEPTKRDLFEQTKQKFLTFFAPEKNMSYWIGNTSREAYDFQATACELLRFADDDEQCLSSGITFDKLQCLYPRRMLNDLIITGYIKMIVERNSVKMWKKIVWFDTCLSEVIYPIPSKPERTEESKTRSMRRCMPHIFDRNAIFIIPVCAKTEPNGVGHWFFLSYEASTNILTYYDTMSLEENDMKKRVQQQLEYGLKKYPPPNTEEYVIPEVEQMGWENKMNYARVQANMTDCGVFVAQNIEMVARGSKAVACQDDMPIYRAVMLLEFLCGSLLERP